MYNFYTKNFTHKSKSNIDLIGDYEEKTNYTYIERYMYIFFLTHHIFYYYISVEYGRSHDGGNRYLNCDH